MLKIALPAHRGAAQIRTIAAARGQGYVRLLAHDIGRGAMLQEALGPPLDELDLPPEQMIAALCRTLGRAWGAPPDPAAGPHRTRPGTSAGWSGRAPMRL